MQLLGTCAANCTCLQESNIYSELCLILYIDVMYHFILYTEPHLKSMKECFLNVNYMNNNKDCFFSKECVYMRVAHQFVACNNAGHLKTRSFKTVCMDKWIHSQNLVCI